jgi:FtsP/CotA-like multicopper oxidase with cupredoxin domain
MKNRSQGAGRSSWNRSGRLFAALVLTLAAMVAAAVRPARTQTPGADQLAPLAEPFALRSVNGVLDATLTLQEGPAQIAGQTVNGVWTYHVDGMPHYPGPTLYVNPGDTIRLKYVNRLPGADPSDPLRGHTNLHTHGLHVSPLGNSDNVLLDIPPGAQNQFVIRLPSNHPQGLYWYHPHRHGEVDAQIFQGLAGLLVIGRPDGGAPELNGAKQRLLALQYSSFPSGSLQEPPFDGSGNFTAPRTYTVNGQLNPKIDIQPGETQVWNLANISDNGFFLLRIRGTGGAQDQPLVLVAQDGNPFTTPVSLTAQQPLLVPPATRYALVVQGPPAGTYELVMEPWFDGFHTWPVNDPGASQALATIVSAGAQQTPIPIPASLTAPNNAFEPLNVLGDDKVYRRTATWQTALDTAGNFYTLINGRQFPDNPLFQPRLNTVEEWTLVNLVGLDTEHHPFHIHVNDFQVISLTDPTGQMSMMPLYQSPITPQSWYSDIINIPRTLSNTNPGTVVLRMKPLDFLGTYVYHCHRVDHEDAGMMALVTIIPEVPIYAAATGRGTPARVRVFSSVDDSLLAEFNAFDASFRGGARVAVGDVNQDAVMDVAVASGAGSPPRVRVLSGKDAFKTELFNLDASKLGYDARFRAGLNVAAGDINSDGYDDLIVAPGAGAVPEVKVFSGADGSLLGHFMAYDQKFRGGVNVASAILQDGGRYSIITAPGPGSAQPLKVFDVDWYGQHARVAAGCHCGACRCDTCQCGSCACGNCACGNCRCGATVAAEPPGTIGSLPIFETASLMPYGPTFRGGVNVATGPIEGQNGGFGAILTGPASDGPPLVKSLVLMRHAGGHQHTDITAPAMLHEVASLLAYDLSYRSGVSVSAVSTPVGADVIVGPAGGAPPVLKRFHFLPNPGTPGIFVPVTDFAAFDSQFRGGVSVAAR